MIRFNCPNCNRPYELPPALAFLPLVCKQCGQRITPPADTPDAPSSPTRAQSQPKPIVTAPPPKPALLVAKIVAPPPAKAAAPVKKLPPLQATPPVVTLPPSESVKPPLPPDDEDDGVLVTKPDTTPDIDFNVGGPTATSLSEATRARPAGLNEATRPRPAKLDGATEPEINLGLLGPEPPPRVKRSPKFPEPEAPPEAQPEPTLVPFIADLLVFVALVVIGMVVGELLAGKNSGAVLSEAGSATKFPPTDLLLWGGPPVMFGLIYLLLGSRKRTVGEWLRRRKK